MRDVPRARGREIVTFDDGTKVPHVVAVSKVPCDRVAIVPIGVVEGSADHERRTFGHGGGVCLGGDARRGVDLQLCDKRVVAPTVRSVVGARSDGEVPGSRDACDVHVTGRTEGNGKALLTAVFPTEERGIDEVVLPL